MQAPIQLVHCHCASAHITSLSGQSYISEARSYLIVESIGIWLCWFKRLRDSLRRRLFPRYLSVQITYSSNSRSSFRPLSESFDELATRMSESSEPVARPTYIQIQTHLPCYQPTGPSVSIHVPLQLGRACSTARHESRNLSLRHVGVAL